MLLGGQGEKVQADADMDAPCAVVMDYVVEKVGIFVGGDFSSAGFVIRCYGAGWGVVLQARSMSKLQALTQWSSQWQRPGWRWKWCFDRGHRRAGSRALPTPPNTEGSQSSLARADWPVSLSLACLGLAAQCTDGPRGGCDACGSPRKSTPARPPLRTGLALSEGSIHPAISRQSTNKSPKTPRGPPASRSDRLAQKRSSLPEPPTRAVVLPRPTSSRVSRLAPHRLASPAW